MEGNEEKEVAMSGKSIEGIDQIRVYGEETFGEKKADEYHQSQISWWYKRKGSLSDQWKLSKLISSSIASQ